MQLEKTYISILKSEIRQSSAPGGVKFYVFGSRSNGTNRKNSDVDLALVSDRKIPLDYKLKLAGRFDESNIPYKVDIVELAQTSRIFRDVVTKEMVELHV